MKVVPCVVICAGILGAGSRSLGQPCPGDINGDLKVTIDEVLTVVNAALTSCGGAPISTPTRTPITPRVSTATPTRTRTPTPPVARNDLRQLIGTWVFSYTIINTFDQRFRFSDLRTLSDGSLGLFGTDLGDGGTVLVERGVDLPGGLPYDFAALHVGIFLCDFFEFNVTIPGQVAGAYFAAFVLADGSCGNLQAQGDAMNGIRTSSAALLSEAVPSGTESERMNKLLHSMH